LNPATRFVQWIESFEPTGTDMIFERRRPSLYASTMFAEVMNYTNGNFVLAGFASESACLSTAVELSLRSSRHISRRCVCQPWP